MPAWPAGSEGWGDTFVIGVVWNDTTNYQQSFVHIDTVAGSRALRVSSAPFFCYFCL